MYIRSDFFTERQKRILFLPVAVYKVAKILNKNSSFISN